MSRILFRRLAVDVQAPLASSVGGGICGPARVRTGIMPASRKTSLKADQYNKNIGKAPLGCGVRANGGGGSARPRRAPSP